jgi:type I restriction enzyme S subunit
MNKILQKIGVRDESFELLTVRQLVAENILEKPLDGNHGEIHPKGEDFVAEGVPFIMATDVNKGHVDYESCNFITAKQADGLRKGFARNGDVLVTHKATIGRTAIVNYDKHPYVMLTPQVTYYRVKNKRRLDNRYLRHYFDSELFQKTLHLWADSGSTRAYLGITEQQKLPIIAPPIEKQRKIAAILSAYDELIENNNRRIALLEKLAEEIYREWFVRFRFPDHKHIKLLKGIPGGWTFDKASQFFVLVKGKSYSGDEITENPEDMPFISLKSFNRGGGYREDGLKYYSGRYKDDQVVRQNDVVVAITDMTQDRAVVGRAARIPNLGARGAVISLDAVKLVPHNINITFLYSYMRHSGVC